VTAGVGLDQLLQLAHVQIFNDDISVGFSSVFSMTPFPTKRITGSLSDLLYDKRVHIFVDYSNLLYITIISRNIRA
jgi:hypothetical protein